MSIRNVVVTYRVYTIMKDFTPYGMCHDGKSVYVVGTSGGKGVVYELGGGVVAETKNWLVDCVYDGGLHAVGKDYYNAGKVSSLGFNAYWVVKYDDLYIGGWKEERGAYYWHFSKRSSYISTEIRGSSWSATANEKGVWAVGDTAGGSLIVHINAGRLAGILFIRTPLLNAACALRDLIIAGGYGGIYAVSNFKINRRVKLGNVAKLLCLDRLFVFEIGGRIVILNKDLKIEDVVETGVEFKIGKPVYLDGVVYSAGVRGGNGVVVEIPVEERVELLPVDDSTLVR